MRVWAAAVLSLGLLSGCVGPPPPDVVLVTVDTLRADHVGAYGSTTASTPVMDGLAAEGLVFERAVAPLPETRPSHATIFTSLYPRDHGVLSNASPWPEGLITLPRLFAEAGWETAGFAGCALFDRESGERLGFPVFDPPEKPQRQAREVIDPALEWLAGLPSERRVFLWVHLFDPHMPYLPPAPFHRAGSPEKMVERWPELSWPDLFAVAGRHGGDLPRRVFERGKALYSGEVEYADHELGRLFDGLRELGRWENSLVLLVSDHGECFENGVYFDHSHCLGEGALAVPLILRYPGVVERGRAEATVELLDVAPTLLELAGLEAPETFGGRSLLEPRSEEARAFFQHPLYRRVDVEDRRKVVERLRSVAGEPTRRIDYQWPPVGVRQGPWKYLLEERGGTLLHLEGDPEERRDVGSDHPAVAEELRAALRRWIADHPVRPADVESLDPDLRGRLEALGYL